MVFTGEAYLRGATHQFYITLDDSKTLVYRQIGEIV